MTKRKARLRLGYVAWTLFLATTLAPSVSYSVSVDPTTAKILRDIEECKMLASVKSPQPGEWKYAPGVGGVWSPPSIGIPDRNKRRIEGLMSSIYAEYNRNISLPGYENVCIMTSVDPAGLESTYRDWEANKKLQVLHELIIFSRELVANNLRVTGVPDFIKHIINIRESCKQLEDEAAKPANANNEINILRVAYWRLRFIEPVVGVKEILASVEAKIEIESVKSALKESIDKGKSSAELEQRIAKLPERARKDIEDLRSKLLDEQVKQVAMAKEEEDRREKALRRQQEIDQAIKLRKKEIDTRKTNSVLQEQLDKNPELKKVVDLWGSRYRVLANEETAKDDETDLYLLQLKKERKVNEERRRREAEAAERQRVDQESRIKAKLTKYNVKAELTVYELCSNPFRYEGRVVIIRLWFNRMMERTVGIFGYPGSDCEILVSNLPSDLFTMKNTTAVLIVQVKGTAEVTNILGARLKIPHMEYIDVLQ